MRFDIITIFPKIFDSYFSESIIKRAQKDKLIEIDIHNLRDWTADKHRTVDDTPYGGGAGMILKVEPVYKAMQEISAKCKVKSEKSGCSLRSRTILFSAKGKKYTQADAKRLLEYDNLIFICGRYEGVDERVAEHIADEEISIGEYVLTGGEIPAMILVDSITRLLPGVLGNPDSLNEESFSLNSENDLKAISYPPARFAEASARRVGEAGNLKPNLEYPQYTKPENFNGWKVPEILLSGNHGEIRAWRQGNSKKLNG